MSTDYQQIWKRMKGVHKDTLFDDVKIIRSHYINLLALANQKKKDFHYEIYLESVIDDWEMAEGMLSAQKGGEFLQFLHTLDDDVRETVDKLNREEMTRVFNQLPG